jgi:hypothetical protein
VVLDCVDDLEGVLGCVYIEERIRISIYLT